MTQSKKFTFNKADMEAIGRGLVIAAAGAALTFLAEQVPNIDFGPYTPFIAGGVMVLINAARKFIAGK